MQKRLSYLIISLLVLSFCFGLFNFAFAQPTTNPIEGLNQTAGEIKSIPTGGEPDLATTIGKIIGYFLSFLGIVFLILMIYAGFLWMTAGGNDEKVKKAIDIAINGGIGLVVVFAAYLITKYVGDAILRSLGI